jgi:hypothetical protein
MGKMWWCRLGVIRRRCHDAEGHGLRGQTEGSGTAEEAMGKKAERKV